MQNKVATQAVLAYYNPQELPTALVQGRAVVSTPEDLLNALQDDPTQVLIVYPLLSAELLQNPEAMQLWQAFYQPLVSMRLRGAHGLEWTPLDAWAAQQGQVCVLPTPPSALVLKLANMLYPHAIELQDQLELNAVGLQRDPVFAPLHGVFQHEEVQELLSRLDANMQPTSSGQQLADSIYKNKADLLEAQLQLLQSEFANTNQELEELRAESMRTADLILKAGSRIFKGT